MANVAYLFERFPSFGQTFCYREVAEIQRQGTNIDVYSIRRPVGESRQDWDERIVSRVHYLPDEDPLVREIDRMLRQNQVSEQARRAIEKWGRQSDFLRLYQAVYVGLQMKKRGARQLHAHFAGMAARTAFWINQFFGTPYSFTAHANDIFAPHGFVVSLKDLIDNAAAIVAVSEFGAQYLRMHYPEAAAKVHRIYNGLDLSRFHPADFGSGVPAIISIGRLIEKKGFEDLIDACALLKSRRRPFTCEIIGEGPLEKELRTRITKNDLESCVKLAGPRTQTEIAISLAHATIFALPCRKDESGGMDNLPTVIMEAMAAGLPVISTHIGGIPEMVENGFNGTLIPQREPETLCRAIEDLIANPERARRLGDHGHGLARERFSIEGSGRSLRGLFERIGSEQPSSARS